ncbi:hypothetical protein ACKVWC_011593 [Pyricularia oryzae]
MDVGRDNVNDGADSLSDALALPASDGVGGGDGSVAAAGAEDATNLANQILELAGGAVAVEQGLVTNNTHLNEVPLSPRLDGADLLGNLGAAVGAARLANKDTNDHLDTVLAARSTDVGEGVAVGRVNTDSLEATGLDLGNVAVDLLGRLAHATVAVGGVGHGPLVATTQLRGRGSRGRRDGRRRDGGRGLRSLGRRGLGRGRSGRRSRSGRRGGGDSRGRGVSGEWAVDHGLGVNDGGDGRGGVGARGVGGDGRNSHGGLGGDGSGGATNDIGAGRRADEGGLGDNAGHNAVGLGLDGRHGAHNRGGRGDDGGDTADGVGARGNLGRRRSTGRDGLGQDHGRRREGVGARGGALLRDRGRDRGRGRGLGGRGRLGRIRDQGGLAVDGGVVGLALRHADGRVVGSPLGEEVIVVSLAVLAVSADTSGEGRDSGSGDSEALHCCCCCC